MSIIMHFRSSLKHFIQDPDGTTAVEYAVMLALILVAMIAGITAAGGGVSDWWNNINTEFTNNGI